MRKLVLTLFALTTAACSSVSQTTSANLSLTPPSDVKEGFFKVSPDAFYYIDINSVWAESKTKHLIHFDTLVNLSKGMQVYPVPQKFARSVRYPKILNCENYQLSQLDPNYYTEFWGEGDVYIPKQQNEPIIKLKAGSSLYTVSEVLCANIYRN